MEIAWRLAFLATSSLRLTAVTRRVWIPVAIVLLALFGWAIWARIPDYILSGHFCSDNEARFAEALSRDPLLTQPPPGIAPIDIQPVPDPFQPCEGNSDNSYYGGASRGFDLPSTGLGDVESYYRQLATSHGWQVTQPAAGELMGQKMIDGTAVVFHLSGLEHQPRYTAYWVELRYEQLGSTRYLSSRLS